MQVLYWASLISISILVALFVKYKLEKSTSTRDKTHLKALPAIVIIGWIVWTLMMLSGPLMNFQLGIISVVSLCGYLIFRRFTKTDSRLKLLEEALADAKEIDNPNLDEAIIRQRAAIDAEADAISRIYPVTGLENLKSELNDTLENASSRVLIMSGWASGYVIDAEFISKCIRLLSKGVELHIGFGYDSSTDKRMPEWEKKGRGQIGKLMRTAMEQKLDTLLFVYEFDNHYKSLVKDSDYFLTGSINWLSNNRGKNFERAWKNEFPALAEKEFEDCVSLMRPKKVLLRRKFLKPFLEWKD
jgi:phosphatidylserine/phosphatidylglycerophosphate/cardiolipin synthase-like enzyme